MGDSSLPWNGGFITIDDGEPSDPVTQNICVYLLSDINRYVVTRSVRPNTPLVLMFSSLNFLQQTFTSIYR
jgi:hypothetical protein